VFFNQIAGDEERKKFWLKYVRKVASVKIAAPSEVRIRLLTRYPKLKDFLRMRSIKTEYGSPALFFKAENHLVIEFSEMGNATYVYRHSAKTNQFLSMVNVHSTQEFKDTSLETLSYKKFHETPKNRLPQNFRAFHRDDSVTWQDSFTVWLKTIVGI